MSERVCIAEDCLIPPRCKGMCQKHYDNFRRRGDMYSYPKPRTPKVIGCSVEGCANKHRAKGFCSPHYDSWKNHGDPLVAPRIAPKGKYSECSIERCKESHKAKGYCSHHYSSFINHGDPEKARNLKVVYTCSVDYCKDNAKTKGFCGKHYQGYRRHGNPVVSDVDVTLTTSKEGYRVCSTCHEIKLDTEFYYRERFSRGKYYDTACKKCILKQSEEWRRHRMTPESREKMRVASIRNKTLKAYGEAGLAVRERMDSGEPCEICGGYTLKMAIDHDHNTGEVRGLLCGKCNSALGLFNDNIEIMQAAIEYLQRAKAIKALAEWEALKAKNKAMQAKK